MAVSATYRELVEEKLGAVLPAVKTRAMFGGLGIYSGSSFFAIVDDDVLYFKVDATNRPDFEAAGTGPFRPFGEDSDYVMQYYEVPAAVLDDPGQLRDWANKALAVARRKGTRSRKPKKA